MNAFAELAFRLIVLLLIFITPCMPRMKRIKANFSLVKGFTFDMSFYDK